MNETDDDEGRVEIEIDPRHPTEMIANWHIAPRWAQRIVSLVEPDALVESLEYLEGGRTLVRLTYPEP